MGKADRNSHAAFSGERHAKHVQALPVTSRCVIRTGSKLLSIHRSCRFTMRTSIRICIYILVDRYIFFNMIHTEKEGGMTCRGSIMFHKNKKKHLGRIVIPISEILVNISEEKKWKKKRLLLIYFFFKLILSTSLNHLRPAGGEGARIRKERIYASCRVAFFFFSFFFLPS